MTFGRPAMITKTSSGAVPLPAAVDDEFIPSNSSLEVSQPPKRPSIMAFFGKTLELYDIMNDVLLSLYNPSTDPSGEDIHDFYFNNITTEGERSIFELDHCLSRWTKSLPVHLRGEAAMASANPIFCRQSIVLRARSVETCELIILFKFEKRKAYEFVITGFFTYGFFSFGRPSQNIALYVTTPRLTRLYR